jgi:hypothetical protein
MSNITPRLPLSNRDLGAPSGNFRRDMQRTKAISGVQQIVRLAQQANVQSVPPAKSRIGLDVIKLEKGQGTTAPAICRNERALTAVSTVSFSPHRDRHVPSVRFSTRDARRLVRHVVRIANSAGEQLMRGRTRAPLN